MQPAPDVMKNSHFSTALLSLRHGEEVRISELVHRLGSASIGSVLLFFALPMVLPIPAPGISVVFGVPLVLISGQLLLGRQTIWLPAKIARRVLRRADVDRYVGKALPVLRRLEKIVRPRFASLASRAGLRFVGAMSLVLALIIVLPIPLGHLVPGTAISIMAMGLIERDGLAILIGQCIGLGAILLVVFASLGLLMLGRLYF